MSSHLQLKLAPGFIFFLLCKWDDCNSLFHSIFFKLLKNKDFKHTFSFPFAYWHIPFYHAILCPNSFVPPPFLLITKEMARVMALPSPFSRCQSIYIKSTVHEISSLKDWTVDGDALGYYLLALSKKQRGKKGYNITTADIALTLTLMCINQSINMTLLSHPERHGGQLYE